MAALGFAASAQAADTASAPSAQQSKMATCSKEAPDKKGDERKAFMKDCLSAKAETPAAASAPTGQQSRMKTCNVDILPALKGGDSLYRGCMSAAGSEL
jgi:psiF repeat